MSQTLSRWQFRAVDSWFFRETRAHDAVGVSELSSVFPPPVRTLMGAVRTFLGDQLDVDWKAFATGEGTEGQHQLLGDAEQLGELEVKAVVLRHRGETLWPCPADLMVGKTAETQAITRLVPGAPVACDLGHVSLPKVAGEALPGSKVPEHAWLTEAGALSWLRGELPAPEQLIRLDDLVMREPRLGIGRDNAKGTVREGLLYQTQHLRFKEPETQVEVWLTGVPQALLNDITGAQTLRLGGEGRMAEVAISDAASAPGLAHEALPRPAEQADGHQLALWLITPAAISAMDAVPGLPNFQPVTTETGQDAWEGVLHGIRLRLISSCRPRAYREGGWDQREHRPRAVRSYLPAGSILFCELLDGTTIKQAIAALHGQAIGADSAWGKGRMLVAPSRWA